MKLKSRFSVNFKTKEAKAKKLQALSDVGTAACLFEITIIIFNENYVLVIMYSK